MRLFINKLFLFFIPLFVFLIYVFYIEYKMVFSPIRNIDNGEKYILGEPYNEALLRSVKLNRPLDSIKIIALGSSRVLQFSQDMFADSFYNLGYTVVSVYQTTELISKLNLHDKTIIVGLDQWEFNPNWISVHDTSELPCRYSPIQEFFKFQKLQAILQGKIYPRQSPDQAVKLIGSGANMALSGILKDGHFYYGKTIHGQLTNDSTLVGIDYKFRDTKLRIKEQSGRFKPGDYADKNVLNEINHLIAVNKKLNNKLIFFFPPFAPGINETMQQVQGYDYIKNASEMLRKICMENNIPFHDFTAIASNNSDYLDGFHGGQRLYYKMATQFNLNIKPLRFLNAYENENEREYTKIRTDFWGHR